MRFTKLIERFLLFLFVIFIFFKVTFGFYDFYSHNLISSILFFVSSIPMILLSSYCVIISIKFWLGVAFGKIPFSKSEPGVLVLILIPISICSLFAALFFNSDVPYHFFYGFIWIGFILFFFTLPFKLQD